MTTLQRVSIALAGLAVAVLLCVLANHWLKPRVFPSHGPAEPQRTYHALATVTRVEHAAAATTVCFAIDSFAELPAADRRFYETTEAARSAGHGPRCVSAQGVGNLAQGAKLDLFFTLANGGKIAMARIAAGSRDLQTF